MFLIIFSEILEKRSKLRNFFEKKDKTICVPCYLDSEKDLEIIAKSELKKNNILLSQETIKLENRAIENLINKICQDLLIKLSENI